MAARWSFEPDKVGEAADGIKKERLPYSNVNTSLSDQPVREERNIPMPELPLAHGCVRFRFFRDHGRSCKLPPS